MSQHSRAPSLASSSITVNGPLSQSVDGGATGGIISSTASGAASDTSAAPSELEASSDSNSIASLVYNSSRDPRTAGYKAPTTRDIPQIKLLRIEAPDEEVVDQYLRVASSVPAPVSELESNDVPPLDLVPDVFFGEDFELDNPRVFDIITGVDDDAPDDDALLGGRETLLHDKLSWYVDVVEMHLISEISKASGSFFSATASFHEIEHRAASLGEQIKQFHSELSEVKTGVVDQNNETLALREKLDRVKTLSNALDYIRRFLDGMDKLRDLLITDVVLARDQLEILQSLAVSEAAPVQLQSLKAMAEIFGELDTATETIQDHYVNLISDTIIDDLRDSIQAYESQVLSDIFIAKSRRNLTAAAGQLPPDLVNTVESSLKAVRNGPDTISVVSDRVAREVKNTIRGCLPPQDNEDSQLARSLHYMPAEAAEEMCVKLYSRVLAVLLRLRAQQNMLVNIVPCPEAGEILFGAVRSADSRIVRVLKVRKDSTAVLPPPRFARFFSMSDAFIKECEELTGVWPPEVGEFLVVQTQLYLHTYHSSSRQIMEEALNTDNWRREEIPDSLQSLVNGVVESGLADPSSWLAYTRLDTPLENSPSRSSTPAEDAKRPLNLFIEGDAFFISRGTARTIQLIGNYAILIALMPGKFSSDFSMMLADLVGEFNGRVRGLVLGFGATKTAGLKHISVRHLTLASESLRAVVKVLGYIQALAQRHAARDRLPQVGAQLEQVMSNLREHEAEIHRKLVKLMADKITVSCRTIAATDWSRPPLDGEEANKYMKDLVKDTQTVVRIVEDVMPAPIAAGIVSEVFAAYKARLLDAYCRVRLRSQREKDNMMLDLSYFRSKAGQFTGAGNVADVVYEAINNFASPDGFIEPIVEERRSMSSEIDRSTRVSRSSSISGSPAVVAGTPIKPILRNDENTPLSQLSNSRAMSRDNLTEVRRAAGTVESDESISDTDITVDRSSFEVAEIRNGLIVQEAAAEAAAEAQVRSINESADTTEANTSGLNIVVPEDSATIGSILDQQPTGPDSVIHKENDVSRLADSVLEPPAQPKAETPSARDSEEPTEEPERPSDVPEVPEVLEVPAEESEVSAEKSEKEVPVEVPEKPAEVLEESTEQPEESIEELEVPVEKPEKSAKKPEASAEEPVVSAKEHDGSVDEPELPAEEPVEESKEPEVPVEKPAQESDKSAEVPVEVPVEESEKPAREPKEPEKEPEESDKPAEEPKEPEKEPEEPAKEPEEPATKPEEHSEASELPDAAETPLDQPDEALPQSKTPEEPAEAPLKPSTTFEEPKVAAEEREKPINDNETVSEKPTENANESTDTNKEPVPADAGTTNEPEGEDKPKVDAKPKPKKKKKGKKRR